MNNRWNEKNLRFAIKNSKNKCDTLKKIGLKPFTGNYNTLNKYIIQYNIDYTHFTLGFKKNNKPINKISTSKILVSGSTYSNTSSLKQRLYKEGLKKRICEKCGQDEWWNGEKMSLILDHKNGINNDHRLENLRIVCPNCNATLSTHCGKNRKNKSSAIYVGRLCKCGKKIKKENITGFCKKCLVENRKKKKQIHKFCSCGKKIKSTSKQCINCHNKNLRKVNRPPRNKLINDIQYLGYTGTGRKYGVSDNAIRKWLK